MQAYNNLLEIKMTDTNTMEVKTIASFINYKLCKIMFSLNVPKEAISQYRVYIDRSESNIDYKICNKYYCINIKLVVQIQIENWSKGTYV